MMDYLPLSGKFPIIPSAFLSSDLVVIDSLLHNVSYILFVNSPDSEIRNKSLLLSFNLYF